MDLFSQAEHDELAQSILLCPDAAYIAAVQRSHRPPAARHAAPRRHPRLAGRPRRADPHAQHGRGLRDQQPHRARAPGGQLAASPHRWEPLLRHAGAIFLGAYTSESLGDYCAGPNHVLPTSGTARFSSPLGVYDFQKRSSLIEVSEARRAGAGADRRRAGLWRRPAGACARRRDAARRCRAAAAAVGRAFNVRAGGCRQRRGADGAGGGAGAAPVRRVDVARSLAQAAYEPAGRPLGLYDGDEPVGLLLLYDARLDKEEPAEQLYVWRLMVDARYQRLGPGRGWRCSGSSKKRAASACAAGRAVARDGSPAHAGPFYEKLGFRLHRRWSKDGEH